MMRSTAASMGTFQFCSNQFEGFKLCNRLVGEPDPVVFAAMIHFDNDLEQRIVGGDAVADGAGSAKVVRGNGIGIANRLDIEYPQSALDQHGQLLRYGSTTRGGGRRFPARKTGDNALIGRVFGRPAVSNSSSRQPLRIWCESPGKQKRTGPKNGPMRLGKSLGFFRG